MKRYEVEAWGNGWVILDSQSRRLMQGDDWETVGELDAQVLRAEILNRREEENKCKTQCKVIAIR